MSGYKGVCICYMAIFALPGGYSLGTFPTNFRVLRESEVQLSPTPIEPGGPEGDAHIVRYYALERPREAGHLSFCTPS